MSIAGIIGMIVVLVWQIGAFAYLISLAMRKEIDD